MCSLAKRKTVATCARGLSAVLLTASFFGCDAPLDTSRTVEPYGSFGEVLYREACQRVAYLGQLADRDAGKRDTVDVSGALGRAVCVDGAAPPMDAPAKLQAMPGEKSAIVANADTVLPKGILDDMEGFLEAILPLADDGTTDRAVSSVGTLLGNMRDDPAFTDALARMAARDGYRPTKTAGGLVRSLVGYPAIDDFLGNVLGLVAKGGTAETEWKQLLTALSLELKSAQPLADPTDPERNLRLARDVLFTGHPELGSGTLLPLVARDYRGIALANSYPSGGLVAPFVDADGDGLADVDSAGRYVDEAGNPLTVQSPFPIAGAADSGARDGFDRALASDGQTPLYAYFDLDQTALAGLVREGQNLFDPSKDTLLGLAYGAGALLGPRKTQNKIYKDPATGRSSALLYQGYDTSSAALLDLAHAFVQVLGDPAAPDTLQATFTLLDYYESEASRAVAAMLDTSDRGKRHPEAAIPADSTLFDELVPVIVRVLRVPGLARDLLVAMQDPRVRGLAPMIARLMTARDQIDFYHSAAPGYPLVGNLDSPDPVDRNQPDQEYNRSLMQRVTHLVHDANGARFCNKANAVVKDPFIGIILKTYPTPCTLFDIEDLALFYLLNMASDSVRTDAVRYPTAYLGANFCEHIEQSARDLMNLPLVGPEDDYLEGQYGTDITGFRCFPTPKALNRALFLLPEEQSAFMQDSTEPVLTVDGERFIDVHAKSIFAWETKLPNNPSGRSGDTFYDAVRPLIDAFAKHEECDVYDTSIGGCGGSGTRHNAAKIFLDLLSVLHEHWPSPQATVGGYPFQSQSRDFALFAHTDDLHSYEPLLADVLGQSDLVPSTIDLAPVLTSFTVDGSNFGASGLDTILATASYVFDPAWAPPGLAYRDGSTIAFASDGSSVGQVTPFYLMADAFSAKRRALAQAPTAQADAWRNATSTLVDQMLTVDNTGAYYQLHNRHMHAITLIVLDFLRSRVLSHQNAGDIDDWSHTRLTQDLTDALGGPTFAALTDFANKVEGDPAARTKLYQLLSYLTDEANNQIGFQTVITALADGLQAFLDDPDSVPIAHLLGATLDPDRGPLDAQLTFLKKSRDADTKKMLITVLKNLYHQRGDGGYAASDVADIVANLNRVTPGKTGALDGPDYKVLFSELHDFFIDEQHGFTRFVQIVKTRGPY